MSVVDVYDIDAFVMPLIQHGEVVAWFPAGVRSERPEIATVIRVSARSVNIITALRGVKEAVRHIDDPKLKLNQEQRENGGWDYTDGAKDRKRSMESLLARMDRIESQLGLEALEMDAPTSYDEMLARVRQAGIPVKGRPARTWLEAQLRTLPAAT